MNLLFTKQSASDWHVMTYFYLMPYMPLNNLWKHNLRGLRIRHCTIISNSFFCYWILRLFPTSYHSEYDKHFYTHGILSQHLNTSLGQILSCRNTELCFTTSMLPNCFPEKLHQFLPLLLPLLPKEANHTADSSKGFQYYCFKCLPIDSWNAI